MARQYQKYDDNQSTFFSFHRSVKLEIVGHQDLISHNGGGLHSHVHGASTYFGYLIL